MRRRILILLALVSLSATLVDDRQPGGGSTPEFTFLRLVYSGQGWMGSAWQVDYPKADQQFLVALRKLTDFGFVNTENRAIPILEADLFKYPFIYAVEVGHMYLSDEEAAQLELWSKVGYESLRGGVS